MLNVPVTGAFRQTLIVNGEIVRDEIIELPLWLFGETTEEPEPC